MVSTVWSFPCLLFSTHGVPRVQPLVKVGGRDRVPYGVSAGDGLLFWTTLHVDMYFFEQKK